MQTYGLNHGDIRLKRNARVKPGARRYLKRRARATEREEIQQGIEQYRDEEGEPLFEDAWDMSELDDYDNEPVPDGAPPRHWRDSPLPESSYDLDEYADDGWFDDDYDIRPPEPIAYCHWCGDALLNVHDELVCPKCSAKPAARRAGKPKRFGRAS